MSGEQVAEEEEKGAELESGEEPEEEPREQRERTPDRVEGYHGAEAPRAQSSFKAPPIRTQPPSQVGPVTPNLKALTPRFIRPTLIEARTPIITTMYTPKISILAKEVRECRVPILEPWTIRQLPTPFPRLKLNPPTDISIRPLLHAEIVQASKPLRPLIKVPRFPIARVPLLPPPILQPLAICTPKIRARDLAPLKGIEKVVEKEAAEKKPLVVVSETRIAESGSPLGPEGEGIAEPPPEFFDLLFLKKYGGKIESGGPKVIFLLGPGDDGDDYLGVLQTLCVRVYRERKGGLPKPRSIGITLEDRSMHDRFNFIQELAKGMEAGGRIFTVKLEGTEGLLQEFWNHVGRAVMDRIEDLFSQDFGYIIFTKLFVAEISRHHKIDVVYLRKIPMSSELKKKIASLTWGFVRLDEVEFDSFDKIFEEARVKFERKLREIGEPYLTATKRDKESDESDDLHYPIKLFLVKYIAKELGLRSVVEIEKTVQTERSLTQGESGGPRADIYVSASSGRFDSEAFEVETLFGQGDFPLKKIDETIEKYEKVPGIKKVNIVLDNLTFLRHIRGLAEKTKIHEEKRAKGVRNFRLEFYTLDVENERLVGLQEVIERLRHLYKEVEDAKRAPQAEEAAY